MAFFNEFPRSRTYDSDLGWLLAAMKTSLDSLDALTSESRTYFDKVNDLKRQLDAIIAVIEDPIEVWNPAKYYKMYETVEYDGKYYTALKDVPSGIGITDTEYWIESSGIMTVIGVMQADILNLKKELESALKYDKLKRFGYFFSPWAIPNYYPNAFVILDSNTAILSYSAENYDESVYFQKVDLNNGDVLKTGTVQNAYHGNGMCYVPETDELYLVNYYEASPTGVSNKLTVVDATNFTYKRTITVSGVTSISCCSYAGNGNIFIGTKDPFVTYYNIDLDGNITKTYFSSTHSYEWLSFIDYEKKQIWASNGFDLVMVYDYDGNIINSFNYETISDDLSAVSIEMEGFGKLPDGTILISDVGYKRIGNDFVRRHVICSVGNFKRDYDAINIRRVSGTTFYASNTYYPYMCGSSQRPMDSLEYLSLIAKAVDDSRSTIHGLNNTFDESVILRQNNIAFRNITFKGLGAIDSNITLTACTITNEGYAALQKYFGITGADVYNIILSSNSNLYAIDNASNIDALNNPNAIPFYCGFNSTYLTTRVINLPADRPIDTNVRSFPINYAGKFSNALADTPYNTYRQNQNALDDFAHDNFGGIYGACVYSGDATLRTLRDTGVRVNGKNFKGNMITITIGSTDFICDMLADNIIRGLMIVGYTMYYVGVTLSVTNDANGAVVKATNAFLNKITGMNADGTFTFSNVINSEDVFVPKIVLW